MAQLARLMDELTNEVNVLVVGTTSQPQMVDPVLRRPGRFEKEVGRGKESIRHEGLISWQIPIRNNGLVC